MLWTFTLCAGPLSKKRMFSRTKPPLYLETAVAKWNGDAADSANLTLLFDLKESSVSETRFHDTLSQVDPYFVKDIRECMWSLRDLFYKPTISRPSQRILFAKKMVALDERFERASTVDKERMKDEYNDIPIDMRPRHVVMESLLAILDETVGQLPEEEDGADDTIQGINEDAEEINVGPKLMRDFLYENVPLDFAFENTSEVVEELGNDEVNPPWLRNGSLESMTRSSSGPSKRRKSLGEFDGSPSSKRSRSLMTPISGFSGEFSMLRPRLGKPKVTNAGKPKDTNPRIVVPEFKLPKPKGSQSSGLKDFVEPSVGDSD